MTGAERILRTRIAAEGPIGVAEFMEVALGHPEHGYYATRDPLGRAGDFTTAPEISQMFGEMIGLWLADRVASLPSVPVLVELGPGRGALMADALRVAPALRGLPLWLVETSPVLRAEQAARLPRAQWAGALAEVPDGPVLLVANEFLDALPVRQFLGTGGAWHEVQVGLAEEGLAFGLGPALPAGAPVPEGAWREHSPGAEATLREIARRVSAHGGWALVVDYGYRAADRPAGPTLQALRGHARVPALEAPGQADLTWLVDFDAMAGCCAPCAAFHADQGAFLATLGIGHRAAALAQARPDDADAIADALERLTAPAQMGTLFKVLAIGPDGAPPPPGFHGTTDGRTA